MRSRNVLDLLRSGATNFGLLVLTVAVLVAVLEISLRLSGFRYVLYPEDVEFGKPDPQLLKDAFLEDPDLFWVTRDYPEKLAGLRRDPPALVFMGDSCTQFGDYDDALARLVAARRGTELKFGNLGVAGWSSYQGRRQLERDVLPLAPRVVSVYYGWNDHWIGFGIEDRDVARIKRVFSSRWSRSRLVQLVMKAVVATRARFNPFPNRVPVEDFAANLRAMVRLARDRDVRPVLVTAASAHVAGEEPPELALRWLRELSELVPLHRAYVETVRRVAREEDAVLCDAAARFDALSRPELEASFLADGIHLTAEGDRRLAAFLYDCFERAGLWATLLAGHPDADDAFQGLDAAQKPVDR